MRMSHLSQKQRRSYIQDNILLQTEEELAKACGVSRRTIIRDLNRWRQDGGFTRFLYREFFKLYSKEKLENPSKALDRVCFLLARNLQHEGLQTSIDEIRLKWQTNEPDSNHTVHST